MSRAVTSRMCSSLISSVGSASFGATPIRFATAGKAAAARWAKQRPWPAAVSSRTSETKVWTRWIEVSRQFSEASAKSLSSGPCRCRVKREASTSFGYAELGLPDLPSRITPFSRSSPLRRVWRSGSARQLRSRWILGTICWTATATSRGTSASSLGVVREVGAGLWFVRERAKGGAAMPAASANASANADADASTRTRWCGAWGVVPQRSAWTPPWWAAPFVICLHHGKAVKRVSACVNGRRSLLRRATGARRACAPVRSEAGHSHL